MALKKIITLAPKYVALTYFICSLVSGDISVTYLLNWDLCSDILISEFGHFCNICVFLIHVANLL